ncbi:putative Ig domain-containing protein, partial [Nibrella saemangeumensis]|uniref:putative Ig domain-containing protein n=1 Tax=Nibrella saemangeumensis TaxID=1084526 RepID=UPI0031E8FB08
APVANRAPVVQNTIPNQSGTAGTAFSYTVPTNTFSDPDGDVLAYQITGLPAGLTANGLSISGTPTTAGTATVTVRATDPAGLNVSATFSLSVAAAPVANRAPVVQNAIPNQSGTAGTAFSYTVPTNTFSDPDGDVLAYQITGLPAGLSANGLSISGTPTTAGTTTVTVKASDPAGLNATTTFTLTISATPVGGGSGTGLTGNYYNNTSLSGTPVLSRLDPTINFFWNTDSPQPGVVNADEFSVRWTGQVEAPVSGSYSFRTNNDDGTRVWVNNQLIIDNWTPQGPTPKEGSI